MLEFQEAKGILIKREFNDETDSLVCLEANSSCNIEWRVKIEILEQSSVFREENTLVLEKTGKSQLEIFQRTKVSPQIQRYIEK